MAGSGVAPVQPLAWKPLHTAGAALKEKKKEKKKSLQITNAVEVVEKRIGGNVNWYNLYGKQYGCSSEN